MKAIARYLTADQFDWIFVLIMGAVIAVTATRPWFIWLPAALGGGVLAAVVSRLLRKVNAR